MSDFFRKVKILLETIKFEHTLFAMPFALISMLISAQGLPKWDVFLWIIVAMIGARSAAMMFNRVIDINIDSLNPRTCGRALPKGIVSTSWAWGFIAAASLVFVFAAYMLNTFAFILSPVALFALFFYSYTKRFTSFSHLWLGLCLGIAPVGACIAVTGGISFASCVLSCAVMLWTAGFDIIYSLQDVDFDRSQGLYSLPSKFGVSLALIISRLFHFMMVILLSLYGFLSHCDKLFYIGVAVVGIFLVYEHSIISPRDITRVNVAFFGMNGTISMVMLVFTALDIFL